MRDCYEEYKYWLNSEYVDPDTKDELASIADDEQEIESRFGGMMVFGTSGLRGTMKAGTMNMNVYTVRYATQGIANLIKSCGGDIDGNHAEGNGVVIAYDSRNNSHFFACEAACVFAANGIKVYLFEDLRPTPELSFAVRELGAVAGANVTASHNPKEYNGYKIYWADGAQLSPEHAKVVAAEFDKIDIFEDVRMMDFDVAVEKELIEIIGEEIDEKYMACVMAQSVGREYIEKAAHDISIVYTPFHGAGYRLVPEILRRIGITDIIPVEEQMIPDGNFPTVASPNPENTEGFALALKYAKKYNAELVIGTDPDSDRCGAVVRLDEKRFGLDQYMVLSGNQMACLMMDYLFTVKKAQGTLPKNAAACKSIVSTVMADRICELNGVKMFDVLTGFKFIGEKIKEFEASGDYRFVFGFEESIGFLAGTYARDKDAVVAAMLMAELGCYYKSRGMTVYDGLQELYKKYGYYKEFGKSIVFDGFDAQEKMADVMVKLRANPPAEIGEGMLVSKITDYLEDVPGFTKSNVLFYELADGCRAAVRPSGTEPKVKTYVMAQGASETEAQARCDSISAALEKILS